MRKRHSKQTRNEIVQTWLAGLGGVPEIAHAHNMPTSTVYGILKQAGVWKGVDQSGSAVRERQTMERLLANASPDALKQIEFNRKNRGARGRANKVNDALHLLIAKAASEGYGFKTIAEAVFVDSNTVSKYARQVVEIPPRRRPSGQARIDIQIDPARLTIDEYDIPRKTPEPGVFKRLWRWLFG